METGLRRIRYFSVLARELNFRRAAEALNITQPALSRAIAQLEDDVGAILLERTNRRVRLTLAGHTFAAGCTRLLDGLGDTIEQTLKVANGFSGTLAIGYTDTSIAGRLPDVIRTFRAFAPDVNIRLSQLFTSRQLALLPEGAIDVGILTGPVGDERLATSDIQSDRFVALVPHDLAIAKEADIRLADLAEQPFVLGDLEAWSVYNAQLFRHCERAGVRPRIVQTAPEARAIIGLVACGLGVTIMPECLARNVDPRIAALPISDIGEAMLTQAAWLRDAPNPAVIQFAEHLARLGLG